MNDNHDWDLDEDGGAFEKKFEEWDKRNWMTWLSENLSFPFKVTREEDEDDAYFLPGASKAPFRLGHEMEVVGIDGDDADDGIKVEVKEKGEIGSVPLCDLQVNPKRDKNFWLVREYVVWFANRC